MVLRDQQGSGLRRSRTPTPPTPPRSNGPARVAHNSSLSPSPPAQAAQPDRTTQAQGSLILTQPSVYFQTTSEPPCASAAQPDRTTQAQDSLILTQPSAYFQTTSEPPCASAAQPDRTTQAQDSLILTQPPAHFQTTSEPLQPSTQFHYAPAQPDRPDSLTEPSPQSQTSQPPNASTHPDQQDSRRDRIHTVLNRFREIGQRIALVEDWAEYHTLTPSEWREVRVLAEATVENYHRIRVDYDPDRQKLAIRMPASKFHNTVAKDTTEFLLQRFRDHVGDDAQTREFVTLYEVQLEFSKSAENSADYSIFNNRRSRHPKLVVEVGYSSKPTPELAEKYIGLSDGRIRTVVVINLKYEAEKQHSIDIYRLELTATTYKIALSATYVLRKYSEDGATFTNYDNAVKFYPADFGIGAGQENPFTIRFKEFLDIIDVAENSHDVDEPSPLEGKTEPTSKPNSEPANEPAAEAAAKTDAITGSCVQANLCGGQGMPPNDDEEKGKRHQVKSHGCCEADT